jgi:hypothetical protein
MSSGDMGADEKQPDLSELLAGVSTSRYDFTAIFYGWEGWQSMRDSYERAADLLCDGYRDQPGESDDLIIPILFLYRHFLELGIKDLIELAMIVRKKPKDGFSEHHALVRLAHRLSGWVREQLQRALVAMKVGKASKDGFPEHHHLVRLVSLLSGLTREHLQGALITDSEGAEKQVSDSMAQVKTWAKRFQKVDPGSFRFRYPVGKRPKDSNLQAKRHAFPKLSELFDLASLSDLKGEMQRLSDAMHDIGLILSGPTETDSSSGTVRKE